jgi:hypothetical protein
MGLLPEDVNAGVLHAPTRKLLRHLELSAKATAAWPYTEPRSSCSNLYDLLARNPVGERTRQSSEKTYTEFLEHIFDTTRLAAEIFLHTTP